MHKLNSVDYQSSLLSNRIGFLQQEQNRSKMKIRETRALLKKIISVKKDKEMRFEKVNLK